MLKTQKRFTPMAKTKSRLKRYLVALLCVLIWTLY